MTLAQLLSLQEQANAEGEGDADSNGTSSHISIGVGRGSICSATYVSFDFPLNCRMQAFECSNTHVDLSRFAAKSLHIYTSQHQANNRLTTLPTFVPSTIAFSLFNVYSDARSICVEIESAIRLR